MADRMAVMKGGVLQQYDTPERIFADPVNTFVAGFVGSPAMNLIEVEVHRDGGGISLRKEGWSYLLSPENARKAERARTNELVLGARHSTIGLHTEPRPETIPARVYTVEPTGDVTYAHVQLGSAVVVVSVPPSLRLAPDDPVWLELDQQQLHLFDGQTQQSLTAA